MNRNTFLILLFLFLPILTYAQTIEEALGYAQQTSGVTARSLGLGGSLGALGADYSSVISNPAGLGWNRSNQIQLSPGLFINNTETQFVEARSSISETNSLFTPNSIGIIIHTEPKYNKWKTLNFGVGFSRISSYRYRQNFEGTTTGSIGDYYAELANGSLPDQLLDNAPFDANLAWEAFLIEQDPRFSSGTQYIDNAEFFDIADDNFFKRGDRFIQGTRSEINLSAAANYNEKFLIGASLNVSFVKQQNHLNYQESINYFEPDTDFRFNSNLVLLDSLTTTGVGGNFRLGFIYRVSQALRLGATIHTPTFLSLKDDFLTDLEYFYDADFAVDTFDETSAVLALSPLGEQTYGYSSPWRFGLSAGYILGKQGFLTAELNLIDYSSMNFDLRSQNANDLAFEQELSDLFNDSLRSTAISFSIGAEARIAKDWRLRAGIQGNQSAYQSIDGMETLISFGVGYDKGPYFIDAAFQTGSTIGLSTDIYPDQNLRTENKLSQLIISAGIRFE